MSLKTKAINSFSWSAFEGVSNQGVTFLIGIFLARMLEPSDFGLIGLTTVLIAVCNSIVGSGFGNALIRKEDVTDIDYSTVFFVNIFVSILLYCILFLTSDFVSGFLNEPALKDIIKVASLVLIVNAFILVQRSILIRDLDFKTQAIISFISSVLSGFFGLFLATKGYGVWSLVYMTLIKQVLYCLGLWYKSSWSPKWVYSKISFDDLFGYSYKLLISEIINTIYGNIYYFIIGKMYSSVALGYYTRADGFQKPFSSNISLGIKRISFPILSKFQNDAIQLKSKFQKFIRINMMISCLVMFFLITSAKPLVLFTIGAKWKVSIFYLQLLCIPGLLYGLQILNLNLLMVKGYSNLNLKLEIIKKVILIPLVILSSMFSIEVLLYSFVLFSVIEFFINSFYTHKLIDYSVSEQLKDVFVFVVIGLIGALILFPILLLEIPSEFQLFLQCIVYSIYYITLVLSLDIEEFRDVRSFLKAFLNNIKK